jgi:Xaa-Pro aminopeptidase
VGTHPSGTELYPAGRLGDAAAAAAAVDIGALLLTPGPDLRYLIGYDAMPLERLTCLVVPAAGAGLDPFMVVPRLELAAAQASPAGGLDLEVVPWEENEDPYELIGGRLRGIGLDGEAAALGVSDRMWAATLLGFTGPLPAPRRVLASVALRGMRMRKSAAEVAALREAGAAIDRVHARVPGWLRAGRTEREFGADIAEAIVAEGHARTDFVIVGSGPNAASPHHELSDRVLGAGEAVVVDIGGTMPSGYCSDCTRTYVIGEAPAEFAAYYAVLKDAQEAACAAVKPGITPEQVDAAAREPITSAGFGEWFFHRTGHGIGLETHEDPYIVAGNTEPLEPGMAFSVAPGISPGPHGARIEDIVICTDDGGERVNHAPRELIAVDA